LALLLIADCDGPVDPVLYVLWQSRVPSLVFEYVNNQDFKTLYPTFTERDMQYYIYEVLRVR